MTRVYLYSIKDIDAEVFAPPFLAYGDAEAKQLVRDAIEPNSMLHRYPTHYHLYRVAFMVPETGAVEAAKECICSVNDLTYRLPDPTESLENGSGEEENDE